MNEKIVYVETARLARQKGFDQEVNHYYDGNNNLDRTSKYEDITNRCWPQDPGGSNCRSRVGLLSAPTQPHLQKWLREVHNIHIEVYYNQVTYCVCILGKGAVMDKGFLYNTYEEALETGLQEGLNLIKNENTI